MICNNLFGAKPYLDHENYIFKSVYYSLQV